MTLLAALRALAGALVFACSMPSQAADTPTVHGAGATFPLPLYAAWAERWHRDTGAEVSYDPVGSGAGVDLVAHRRVDFGATDMPVPQAELQRLGLLQFPAVIGGVVPVVNIAGLKPGELKLTGEVLADIYLGRVRRWNDTALTALNPTLKLPSAYITVVHREEPSGTTFLWTHFLAQNHPDWQATLGAGSVVAWPVGVGARGNAGVAADVQRTRMSIGYVEYAYARANRLSHASLRNRDGVFVQPGVAGFAAAVAAARWQDGKDLAQVLTNQPGAATWPITGASFILLQQGAAQPLQSQAVLRFIDWALRKGQPIATELDYLPVPDPVVAVIEQAWANALRDQEGRPVWPPPNPQ
jgi:phosphate transport system substrate-binding protein